MRTGGVVLGSTGSLPFSLPLGPAGNSGGGGNAFRGCLSSYPYREAQEEGRSLERECALATPGGSIRGANVFANTRATQLPIPEELDPNPGSTSMRTAISRASAAASLSV